MQPEGQVKDPGRDRDEQDIVDEGPEQVAANRGEGPPGDIKRGDDAAQIPAREGDIRRLDCNIGPRAHRDADFCLGQGGGIIDAVADEGDLTALLLHALDHGRLAVRQGFRVHLRDAGLTRDGLRGLVAVAGDHRHLQAALPQCGHHRRCFGLQRIGDRQHGTHDTIHRKEHRGLAIRGVVVRGLAKFADRDFLTHQITQCTDQNLVSFDLRADTESGDRLEGFGSRQVEAVLPGGGDDRCPQGMFAACLDGSGQAQRGVQIIIGNPQVGEPGTSLGQGAGLVEHDCVDVGEAFQRFTLAVEHTQLGGPAAAHHDGRGRGEPHGARAGHDQHGNGADQRQRDGGFWTECEPGQEGDRGDGDDHRCKDAHHPVGQTLDG